MGALTVSGGGALTATAGSSASALESSTGVEAYSGITLSGSCSLTGIGRDAQASYGVALTSAVVGSITIADSASLTGRGGAGSVSEYGVYAQAGSITVQDSGRIEGSSSSLLAGVGIQCYDTTVKGGTPIASARPNLAMVAGPDLAQYANYSWRITNSDDYTNSSVTQFIFDSSFAYIEICPPTVTSVTVTPATASVVKGDTQQFSAAVDGTKSPPRTVTWDVTNKTSASTNISVAGLLTVGDDETATTLIVSATSTFDTGKSGTAAVTVAPVPPISITPTSTFVQGAAPAIRLTVGAGITGFNPANNLDSVAVNGTTLTSGNEYTPSDGSILIDFAQSWLNSLAPGNYAVTVTLKGGAYQGMQVSTSFTVIAAGSIPKTGDGAPIGLLIGLLLFSGAGLTASVVGRRKWRGAGR